MVKVKFAVVFILGILFTVFVFQNTDVVSVRFLFWEASMSRIILIPAIFILGMIAGFVTGWLIHSPKTNN